MLCYKFIYYFNKSITSKNIVSSLHSSKQIKHNKFALIVIDKTRKTTMNIIFAPGAITSVKLTADTIDKYIESQK